MSKSTLFIALFIICAITAIVGVLLPPVQIEPTLTYGYILLAVSFLFMLIVSLLKVNKADVQTELAIKNAFIICVIHTLVQTAALYVLCAIRLDSNKALLIQIGILLLNILILILLYLITGKIRHQAKEVSESFVSKASHLISRIRMNRLDDSTEQICKRIERLLESSPHFTNRDTAEIESLTLNTLNNALQGSDIDMCNSNLEKVVELIQKRNSI